MCPEYWWTTLDVARYLQLNPTYIRKLAREGKIRAHRIPVPGARRTTWRYRKDEIDQDMEGRTLT